MHTHVLPEVLHQLRQVSAAVLTAVRAVPARHDYRAAHVEELLEGEQGEVDGGWHDCEHIGNVRPPSMWN